jgi:hypothetical protein
MFGYKTRGVTSKKSEGLENGCCKIFNSFFGDISTDRLGIQNMTAYSADGLLAEGQGVY